MALGGAGEPDERGGVEGILLEEVVVAVGFGEVEITAFSTSLRVAGKNWESGEFRCDESRR